MKKQLAEDMIAFTQPIREKAKEYRSNEALLKKVMDLGAEKARESANDTIKQVREIIGFFR
jgi:tryptophanyl-tRNA synthetase